MKDLMHAPVICDLRNIYNPSQMTAAGFHYTSVGRPVARRRARQRAIP